METALESWPGSTTDLKVLPLSVRQLCISKVPVLLYP